MPDPLTISAAVISSLQFVVQLRTYLHERKKRKQEQQQHQHQHQVLHPPIYTYSICNIQNNYHAPPPYFYPQHPAPALPFNYPPALPFNYPRSPYFYPQHPPSLPFNYPPPLPFNYPRSHENIEEPSSSSLHSLISTYDSHPSHIDWLHFFGGQMEPLPQQQAPNITRKTLGMRTGACAFIDQSSSYRHWMSLEKSSQLAAQRTIAVVDWSRRNIDMFMEMGGAYFRNYRIRECQVEIFAKVFKEFEVFSGEIKNQRLERCSKEIKMQVGTISGVGSVHAVHSTNSWMSLGIYDESVDVMREVCEEATFVRAVRGAVFGLVCCLYEAPSDLNVDMETSIYYGHPDLVRINTHQPPWNILKRDTGCCFSVFSLGDHYGWAAQEILVG